MCSVDVPGLPLLICKIVHCQKIDVSCITCMFVSLPSMPGLRYVRNVVFYRRMHPASYVVLRDYIVVYVLTLRNVQSLSSRIYSHLIFFCQGISYKLWDILNWIQCLWYRGSYKCKQTAYAYKGVLDVLMHVPPYYYLYHFRYFCFCVFLLF